MNEIELPKPQKIEKLNQTLGELKNKGNLLGVLFAYRNGGLIGKDFKEDIDFDNFTSMCASVLESATGLGRTMGDRKVNKIIAELEGQTIVIIECDEKTFLVFDINYESNFNIILEKIEGYIRKIIFLY